MKITFYFILKALFVLNVIKFLSWLFGHVGTTAWLEKQGLLRYIQALYEIKALYEVKAGSLPLSCNIFR